MVKDLEELGAIHITQEAMSGRIEDYDPWKVGHRCDDEAPSEHGGVCQLPKGHTCDHVWFGDAGKFSTNPFAGADTKGKSDRWPQEQNE